MKCCGTVRDVPRENVNLLSPLFWRDKTEGKPLSNK